MMREPDCVVCGQPLDEPAGDPLPGITAGAAIAGPTHKEHGDVRPYTDRQPDQPDETEA
jgi:hypothetical protein